MMLIKKYLCIIKTYNLIKYVTVIMVTHDKAEILRLTDKVIVLGRRRKYY